jgi:hypothetical protein
MAVFAMTGVRGEERRENGRSKERERRQGKFGKENKQIGQNKRKLKRKK